MNYIAHLDGEREQSIKEHLEGTANLAAEFAGRFGKADWGYCCGMLHDIGKYSEAFQKRILGLSNQSVDHSTAGAQVCLEKGGYHSFLSYCIAGHHAGLPDFGTSSDSMNEPTLMGRKKKKIPDYHKYREEMVIPEIKTMPFDLRTVPDKDFSLSVFIRMIYSCLVDADFLDTEAFMKDGKSGRVSGEKMEILLKKLEHYVSGWMKNEDLDTVNGHRTEILKHCLELGAENKGLFRLTVPTGGGKTVASLAFALRHAVRHQMDRIIYVIPYTSIIEQNAKVFREILGNENVLENHCNVSFENSEDSEEFEPMRLAAENWDKPVIVTTNVQFFESLFANKSSKCRKLHNIANSVVIFDEAQMLPADYLKPCISMIEEMVARYGVSAVLCTATQPSLEPFFQNIAVPIELCPRIEQQFAFFKRTNIHNIGWLEAEALIQRLNKEEQALCIVNTKKRAQKIYESIEGEGVYHLSTSMYPKHRKRVLEEVRKRLKDKKRCVLISTSLVEAGVDLDFQSVYRQLAGIDSMIQAAGRCNREGKRKAEESPVYIFQFAEKEYLPGQRMQMDTAGSLLEEYENIADLECIKKYFDMLYHFKGQGLDKKEILKEFHNKIYNFAQVGKKFKLIEENTKTIFINQDEEAEQILNQIKNQGFTRESMRKAGQYCINVYEEYLKKLYEAGIVDFVSHKNKDFFELIQQDQYTEEEGLNLESKDGLALFL